jgi:Uncharacterised nucleotidyltransferase
VRRAPGEDIVELLSFSSTPSNRVEELKKVRPRQWQHILRWLDDTGLAFYFLQKLKNIQADTVPTWVISRLERNFAANRQRVDAMSRQFGFLNQKFEEAGVRYAVLKGLSLVPQFCRDATLRHQSDFDYLVDDQSLLAARRVLLEAGYRQKRPDSSKKFAFLMPGTEAFRDGAQYSAQAAHAVELQLDPWDSEDMHRMPAMPRQFSVERSRIQQVNGFAFPALTEEDAFLLQVLHACQHLFTYWIRMACLWEIGYFLDQRASDKSLWSGIEQQVGDNLMLREFVVVITELVAKLFQAPLPNLVRSWGARIRPATRVWIDRYARPWALCEMPAFEFRLFPKAKFVLFLQQQYEDACAQKHVVRDRLLTFARISRMASSIRDQPFIVLNAGWWKHQFLIRRSLFHALSGLRYLCEVPRWRWLNRTKMRVASMDV